MKFNVQHEYVMQSFMYMYTQTAMKMDHKYTNLFHGTCKVLVLGSLLRLIVHQLQLIGIEQELLIDEL